LWEEAGTGKHYDPDKGDKLYRRSLYTFRKRTSPPPNMLTFDATSHEVCTARREVTTTPLQALVLLNDPQFVESARVLAEQLLRAPASSAAQRIVHAFRLTTGRQPEARELEILQKLLEEQFERFSKNAPMAANFTKIGDHPLDGSLPTVELAATTALVNALMNLDDFITLR
jgi:hypothetical protein